MFGEKDIRSPKEAALQQALLNTLHELKSGSRECSDHDHVFLSLNNIHNVICTEMTLSDDEGVKVSTFSLYARPSSVKAVFDIYDNYQKRLAGNRNVSVEFVIRDYNYIQLTIRVQETLDMDQSRVLKMLLDCTTQHFHDVLRSLVEDKKRRDKLKPPTIGGNNARYKRL